MGWLKEKMTKAAANQCRLNIKLNVKTLVLTSNEVNAHINERGGSTDSEKEQVLAAQNSLKDDILLGISNELTMEDIRGVVKDAVKGIEVSEGAEMAIKWVFGSVKDKES